MAEAFHEQPKKSSAQLFIDQGSKRTDSDDEADALLGEFFPDFYYGKTLKLTEVFRAPELDFDKALGRRKQNLQKQKAKEEKAQKKRKDEAFQSKKDEAVIFEEVAMPILKRRKINQVDVARIPDQQKYSFKPKLATNTVIDMAPRDYLISQEDWQDEIVWDDEDIKTQDKSSDLEARLAHEREIAFEKAEAEFKFKSQAQALASQESEGIQPLNSQADMDEGDDDVEEEQDSKKVDGISPRKPRSKEVRYATTIGPDGVARDLSEVLEMSAIDRRIPDHVSLLPFRNKDLTQANWEDDIIWSEKTLEQHDCRPRLVLDHNDEAMLFADNIPKPLRVREIFIQQNKGRHRIPNWKLDIMKDKLAQQGRHALTGEDRYNLSNDRFYKPREGTQSTSHSLLESVRQPSFVTHPSFIRKLKSFFPASFNEKGLRRWHRPLLKPTPSTDTRPIESLQEHILHAAMESRSRNKTSFIKSKADVTAKDGELCFLEYSEEYPLLMMRPGMCSLVRNYYKRRDLYDNKVPRQFKFGQHVALNPNDASPFLGNIKSGEALQSLETNMFRAPLYYHKFARTDFLLIRTKRHLYIRQIENVFTVGQQLPFIEVPAPNSKKAANFLRDRLKVHIYRLFAKARDGRVRVEEVRRLFQNHSEANIRKRLKEVSEFHRGGDDNGAWHWVKGTTMKGEDELQNMVTPEMVCAYESMKATVQRLADMGYKMNSIERVDEEEEDDPDSIQVADEVKMAPWRLTKDFIDCVNGQCLLAVTGPAEPTGVQEGFSYLRLANKPAAAKANAKQDEKLLPKLDTPKKTTGALAKTNKDLRGLYLNEARDILENECGYSREFLMTQDRWQCVHLIRKHATQSSTSGLHERFARGNRSTVAEHQTRFKNECQRIFDLQNQVLASDLVLSTDDESDSDDDDDDLAAQLEEELRQTTGTSTSRHHERADQQALKNISDSTKLKPSSSSMEITSPRSQSGKTTPAFKDGGSVASFATSKADNKPMRKILITRKVRLPDGTTKTTHEMVTNQAVIELYLKRRNENLKKKPSKKKKKIATARRPPIPTPHNLSSAMRSNSESLAGVATSSEDGLKMRVNTAKLDLMKSSSENKQPYEYDTKYNPQSRTERSSSRNPNVSLNSIFEEVINMIMDRGYAKPFVDPVNPKIVADYYSIVKRPINLTALKEKIRKQVYRHRNELLNDLTQMAYNSRIYNGTLSPYTKQAERVIDSASKQLLLHHSSKLDVLEAALAGSDGPVDRVDGHNTPWTKEELSFLDNPLAVIYCNAFSTFPSPSNTPAPTTQPETLSFDQGQFNSKTLTSGKSISNLANFDPVSNPGTPGSLSMMSDIPSTPRQDDILSFGGTPQPASEFDLEMPMSSTSSPFPSQES